MSNHYQHLSVLERELLAFVGLVESGLRGKTVKAQPIMKSGSGPEMEITTLAAEASRLLHLTHGVLAARAAKKEAE